jgi:AcrR family transcriptional regulator
MAPTRTPHQRAAPAHGAAQAVANQAMRQPKVDGRVKRSLVTRQKIVDALTVLVHEGQLSPTAEQVAQGAGIGLRTVFRHFDDMDALYREISPDLDAQVLPLIPSRLTAPTWPERLLQSIALRGDIYDRTAAMHLAAQVHRHQSADLARKLMASAVLQRDLLRRLLPAAVADQAALLDALDLVLSFEAWIRLRREQGLSADQARGVMQLAVEALLATLAPPLR